MCPTILLAVFNELNCYHTSTLVLYEFIVPWHILNAPLRMFSCDVSVMVACPGIALFTNQYCWSF